MPTNNTSQREQRSGRVESLYRELSHASEATLPQIYDSLTFQFFANVWVHLKPVYFQTNSPSSEGLWVIVCLYSSSLQPVHAIVSLQFLWTLWVNSVQFQFLCFMNINNGCVVCGLFGYTCYSWTTVFLISLTSNMPQQLGAMLYFYTTVTSKSF